MGKQHIIELNGKKYDALTGKLLAHSEIPVRKITPVHAAHRSMDGIVKKKPHAPRKVTNTHIAHHEVAKSKTLMRKSVKKPAPITALHGTRGKQQPSILVTPPMQQAVVKTVPAGRIDRAGHIKKSSLINRYGSDVIAAPKNTSHKTSAHQATHAVMTSVSAPVPAEQPDKADALLASAFSHNEPRLKKTPAHHKVARKLHMRPGTFKLSAAVLAFFVLGGFFAYSNVPNLSMRVASMRSDVNASLPRYSPAGFSMYGPIKYQPGEVVVGYKSNSDTRGYQVTLRASAWDTESLRENYVAGLKSAYQTVQNKGKTVYLYDDSSATWVDGGVWYKIEGNSQLNTDQLLRIASSL